MKYATIFAAALLAACSGGGGGGTDDVGNLNEAIDQRCQSLGQSGATAEFTSAGCPDCSAADEQNAIDRVDRTFASLTAPFVSSGTMTLRAVAPVGVTYPGGSNAAVTLSVADGSGFSVSGATVNESNHQDWHVTIRTYLGGVLQEQEHGRRGVYRRAG